MMPNTKGLFRNLREIGSRVRKFDGNVEIDWGRVGEAEKVLKINEGL